ncbi:hypothetical protein JB92DRAFT_1112764 [Gautieria morchelliformis]|nr:hypothetical protein JB92DRAFT_1112764 [Gautieria morchelliformis]
MDRQVLQGYIDDKEEISALVSSKVSTALSTTAGEARYDNSVSPVVMCVFMLASSGYTLDERSIKGINNQAFASLWRTVYLCSLSNTDSGRWVRKHLRNRTRDIFCRIKGLSERHAEDGLEPFPSDVLEEMSSETFSQNHVARRDSKNMSLLSPSMHILSMNLNLRRSSKTAVRFPSDESLPEDVKESGVVLLCVDASVRRRERALFLVGFISAETQRRVCFSATDARRRAVSDVSRKVLVSAGSPACMCLRVYVIMGPNPQTLTNETFTCLYMSHPETGSKPSNESGASFPMTRKRFALSSLKDALKLVSEYSLITEAHDSDRASAATPASFSKSSMHEATTGVNTETVTTKRSLVHTSIICSLRDTPEAS